MASDLDTNINEGIVLAENEIHIDHCFAHPSFVKSVVIHARWEWLALSDHLPIEIVTA